MAPRRRAGPAGAPGRLQRWSVGCRTAREHLGLNLANGERCRLRDGGAWGAPQNHPDYVGYYSCGPRDIVWARPNSSTGGIDRTTRNWTVLIGDVTGPLTTIGVTTAAFVTTAA
ncbi:hypothetical protein MXD61_26430 [Frankia sp. AgPm24]|uniref:hypothetical protein n=1 Tax=Frankia sp. AgPm24 TaxID=631128 RepID=UPI00200E3082|nr:hypothetical protein [Frankia sp. AgPm24]MCK9925369.1 hypothetical protein [Frankia sp. AgPm24]